MLTVKPVTNKKIWENFCLSSNQANFLQSYNWGEFHSKINHPVFRLGVFDDQALKGVAQIIKIQAKRATYLECPGGPIIPWQDKSIRQTLFTSIKQLAKQEKASFLRLRANIPATKENLSIAKRLKLIKAPMHLHAETTWVLDLKPPLESLLKSMRKNTRYSIRKAEKLGVKVELSSSIQDINTLYQLQLQVAKRSKFIPFSKDYLLKQFQTFNQDNQIQLFKAIYKGQVLAISFILFYGKEAVYHYSGSSSQLRNIPASYALQWAAIKEAKSRGLSFYNFWGIAPPNQPHHRFSKVTLFKQGFGGRQLDYLPAHDLPFNLTYYLTYLFETLRRLTRRL